ncbi:MAG: nitrile hydratase subunit alpha, partial [Candidatus Eremiobacteraeota bacterium]|nr:nitrile hydratase subunit alpha [Candidatus Eremiobacteraeota bacterium]
MSEHAHDHEQSAQLSNRVKTLIAALSERGLVTEEQLDATVEGFLLHAKPANAFAVIARAWKDPEYKKRLLADASSAVTELGIDMSHWAPVKLRAVENTVDVHNIIVCTLCSCYPIAFLGPSPKWYKSEAYRSRVVLDPRGVLAEFGVHLAENIRIHVWDSTSELRYFVIPVRPDGTEACS